MCWGGEGKGEGGMQTERSPLETLLLDGGSRLGSPPQGSRRTALLLDEWTRVSAEEGDDFMGLKWNWLLHRSSITRMRDVILHMLRVPHSLRACVCAVNTVCVCVCDGATTFEIRFSPPQLLMKLLQPRSGVKLWPD